jgi:hypothetical protein
MARFSAVFLLGIIVFAAFLPGAACQVSFAPIQLTFNPTFVGKPSATLFATLTNSGNVGVLLFPGATTGDFSVQSSNCPYSSAVSTIPFPPGASCILSMQFTPMVVGLDAGATNVQITDVSFQPLGSATLTLQGTGLFPLTVSPAQLNFGFQLENPNVAPTLPLTLTNNGGVPLTVSPSSTNADYGVDVSQCSLSFFTAGTSCVVTVSFAPTATGADAGLLMLTASIFGGPSLGNGSPVPLSGVGHPLSVSSSVNFGLQLLGGSYQAAVNVFNTSNLPVNISSVILSGGSFAKDNGCIGMLAARSSCAVNVTFAPSAAGILQGTLTLYDDDPTSPQTVTITGTATALKVVVENSGFQNVFPFFAQRLLTTSPAQTVTLTNVSKFPVPFQTAINGNGFASLNTCGSRVPANGSCAVSVTYRPTVDGLTRGTLVVTPSDPIGPQTVSLAGEGVGIANLKIRLHYDYMVAPDHTHDPEIVAPGAIQRVVDAFARHGVELIVDPHHTGIPEVPVVTFADPGVVCPGSQGNFFDLRNKYFSPKFPDQHYVIFAHSSADPGGLTGCVVGPTGAADLPGLNFVVSLGAEQSQLPDDFFSLMTSGTMMHELGHNLGLNHGGGLGATGDELNYKPNFLSIMNYAHQFSGIVQANIVSSTTVSSCNVDSDCGPGQSCISYASGSNYSRKSCRRLDYSTQVLPVGGNTPGILDESDLDETAGLDSGNPDLALFSTCETSPFWTVFASNGPVDWDGDGVASNRHLAENIDFAWFLSLNSTDDCTTPLPLLRLVGSDDWGDLMGTSTSAFAALRSTPVTQSAASQPDPQLLLDKLLHPERHRPVELDSAIARRHHVLFPIRPASVIVRPGCTASAKPIDLGSAGTLIVALLSTSDFDVTQVDLSSLQFHHARPVSTALRDVNGDGLPDLVIEIRVSDLHLANGTSTARLSGWLKNSQAFFGEDQVRVVANLLNEAPNCR